ncbi:transmembrane protein [Heterostelium album PN500]|uniref:Transmembrane protein n=1 Tax=Heterostelium pallidum (strain ATCC 26659 / Pp 5 / PN500) TaxID=670386 RepID=D3B5D6_HETP5|nr:transmembrane protein [Heterostelium album PN500]EFA83084.1 transmembrane protein [Heterostelium album PN500]|eukprot:XP_020435201.1 transmembrane protein [Heterostelium album PN500]
MSDKVHITAQSSSVDHSLEAIAGGLAGMSTIALTYPFSTVSTRLQVQQKQANKQQQNPQQVLPVPYKGTLDAFQRIIAEEHWTSLYNGLKSALIGIGCSSFVYYYWYSLLKSISLKFQNKSELGTLENLLIAALSESFTNNKIINCLGAANVITTLPIWVVNTRLQLKSNKGIVDQFKTIIRDEGVGGLYNGLIPALILVSNPSVQFVSYEKLRSIWKRYKGTSKLNSLEIFVLGAIAKLIAGVVTYPYLLVKSRLQATASSESPYKGTFDAITKIFKSDGFLGFFKGMPSKMVQTVLGAAFMFLVKEKIVYYTVYEINTEYNIIKYFPSVPYH